MFFKFLKNLFLIFVVFNSCSIRNTADMNDIEDFILESYKIDEGKVSILEMNGEKTGSLDPGLLKEQEDLIEEEDILNIEVFHPVREDLVLSINNISQTKGFIVRDKKIFIPCLDYIEVEGLTIKEASDKIQKRFVSEIKDIQVIVSYKKKIDKKIEIAGLANKEIFIDSKTRLFDVLIKINLPPEANLFKSYVLRDNHFLPIDFYRLLKKGDMSQNIIMKNLDKIYIAETTSSKVYVLGEVSQQKVISIPDGKISLKEAIAMSGGVLPTADKSYIQVFRTNTQNPKIFVLTWDHIIKLPSHCLNLIEGDIVYVVTNPITDWNRFISQILPTMSFIDASYRGFKNIGNIINGK